MKKLIFCIFLFSLIILGGCDLDQSSSEMSYTHLDEVVRCFKEKDSSSIELLLCNYIKESDVLEEEIENAFDFFKGNVVFDGKYEGMGTSAKAVDNGTTTRIMINPRKYDIEMDNGNKYAISFGEYIVNKEHEDYIGITYITIKLEGEDEYYTIGDITLE